MVADLTIRFRERRLHMVLSRQHRSSNAWLLYLATRIICLVISGLLLNASFTTATVLHCIIGVISGSRQAPCTAPRNIFMMDHIGQLADSSPPEKHLLCPSILFVCPTFVGHFTLWCVYLSSRIIFDCIGVGRLLVPSFLQ